MVYILFVIGFFFLIKWADMLVDGASSLARRFNLSDLIIWLTIVAFGTSVPELVVNVISSISWNSWLVVGNVLWSNIANILLIFWLSAIIYPLTISRKTVFVELPFSIFAVVLLGILINDSFFYGHMISSLSRIDGCILLFFFGLFVRYIFRTSKTKKDLPIQTVIQDMSLNRMIIYIVVGLIGLILWGQWIVNGAITIAEFFWVWQSVIGLTIVALWTSLPELTTSIVAMMKKKSDIAIGNVVGSNIFNILRILWLSTIISPITDNLYINNDIWFLFLINGILFLFFFVGKKFVLQRYQWWIMVFFYCLYIASVFIGAR